MTHFLRASLILFYILCCEKDSTLTRRIRMHLELLILCWNDQRKLSRGQTSSGERVQDFADLIWRDPEENAVVEGAGETAATPACVVGVGVNCTAPNHVAGVMKTLSETARKHHPPTHCSTTAAHLENTGTRALAPKLSGAGATAPPGSRCRPRESPPGIALVVYPNSGEEWDAGARDWVQGTGLRGVEEIGRLAREEWYLEGKGARVFGGCCRIRPEHIAEIRRALASCAVVSVENRERGFPSGHQSVR